MAASSLAYDFVDEPARHRDKVGIAQPIRPIREGELERLGRDVCGRQRIVLVDRAHVEVFENVEHLRDVDAAGAWRRKADDLVTAIRRVQRLAQLRFVRGKIGRREMPPLAAIQSPTFFASSPR